MMDTTRVDSPIETMRAKLTEAEAVLAAIRQGEIDALVIEAAADSRIYTLQSAEEPYRDFVEQMQEGAVALTPRGHILYANACFAMLVGEPLESVVGSGLDRFVSASDRDELAALLRAGAGRCRVRLIRPDARPVDVMLSLTTASLRGRGGLNLIVTDLSELLEIENLRDRATRDNRTKDEFLAMVAHELRTPLSAINDAVRLFELAHAEGEAATRAHAVIERQVGHISYLINELLDLERVVSGKLRLARQPLDLAEAVRRAVAGVTSDPRLSRHIEISTEPVWVDGDAVRLQQVLTNVVTNAVKYTLTGGRIRVALRADGDDAVVSVEDDGVGIPCDLLPSIFDLYVQSDRTLDRARGGLGIGLTIARRLVELHGGTIAASSGGRGHGSTFTIRLRQVPSAGTSLPAPFPPERRARPRRVLLIEDSEDAREMLRMMLQLAGHEVYDAADGVRGLELLNAVRPDVGIIDISLPRMDGYQVAERIRENAHGRGMLLVALTGYGSPEDSKQSLERGFDHHLIKPIDPDHLAQLISDGAHASWEGASR